MQYQIVGEALPVAVLDMVPGESVYTERGGMSWMTDDFKMETNMEGGLMSAVARKFAGESMFLTSYTAVTAGQIAFSSEFPGEIIALKLGTDESMICQKDSFMAAERSVTLAHHFRKRLGAGLFGGEGFILQKLTGPGIAFVELDGTVVNYTLGPGEIMKVDTGYVAMYEPTVQLEIETVRGFKNVLFSGEGLFMTKLVGPGKIWLQTMPFNRLADKIMSRFPK